MSEFFNQNIQLIALTILVIFVVSGYNFRRNWQRKGKNWQRNCWATGLSACISFLFLAFMPLSLT
ncbi:MAG: hypothetical protein COB24_12570 [Hyphomicrobiales bacterium]|nr:MAG: hypothetical protein COB24_12570 [Hyphomicrobiales bacterium]